MAPLRVPGNFLSNDVTDFFDYSTQPPGHETRHHNRHHSHRESHKNQNVADLLSSSIMDAMNTKFVPENSVLPDLEPLSTHMDHSMDDHHPLRMNVTLNRSDLFAISEEFMYRHNGVMTAVYCAAYLLVFLVGLVGNFFVIAVVYRSPRMRTVTNFFIVNLAMADILVVVFCLPATLMSNIFVRDHEIEVATEPPLQEVEVSAELPLEKGRIPTKGQNKKTKPSSSRSPSSHIKNSQHNIYLKQKKKVESTNSIKRKFYQKKLECALLEKKTCLVNYKISLKKEKLIDLEIKMKQLQHNKD